MRIGEGVNAGLVRHNRRRGWWRTVSGGSASGAVCGGGAGGKRVAPRRFWSVHIVRWRAVTLPRHKGRLVPHIHHHHLPLLSLLLLPSSSSSLENDTFYGTFSYFSRIYGGWTRVSTLPDSWPSMLQFRVVIPRYRKKYILSRPPARSRVLAI